jgi:hypothetical protein
MGGRRQTMNLQENQAFFQFSSNFLNKLVQILHRVKLCMTSEAPTQPQQPSQVEGEIDTGESETGKLMLERAFCGEVIDEITRRWFNDLNSIRKLTFKEALR